MAGYSKLFDSVFFILTLKYILQLSFIHFPLQPRIPIFRIKYSVRWNHCWKVVFNRKKHHWFARILPFADWKSIYWILKCIFHLQKKYLWKNNIHMGKEKNLLIAASSSLHRRIDREKALIIFLANNQGNRNSSEGYFCFKRERRDRVWNYRGLIPV